VTAVAQVTASRVSPTTGGTYGIDDTYLVHSALPARFRQNGDSLAWMCSVNVSDRTRKLLMAQNSANSAWTDASRGQPPTLLGDNIYEGSTMSTSFTTGQDILLYGDFSRYYIIDRVGFSVEFIPNYFDTSTGRPTAQRGWLAHWRTGANTVDANAFRILRL
jgi:HK97 family phage major capsid protein